MLKKSKVRYLITSSLMLLSLMLVLVACTGGQTSNGGNESEQEVFELYLNSIFEDSGDSSKYLTSEFAEEIEKRSNGRIKISAHYTNELVPPDELIAALDSGTVDFGLTTPGYYADSIPTGNIALLPFWANSREEGYELLRETEVGEILEQEFEENGAKIIAYDLYSQYTILSNKYVESYEDLKGLLIRSAGGGTDLLFDEIGISHTPISAADFYEAMQRGVVDAAPSAIAALEANKYGEVTDYVIEPPLMGTAPTTLFISMKTWEKLPEDLQDVVQEVALEMEQKAFKHVSEDIERLPEILEKYDIEVIEFSEEDREKLFESAQAVWDEFAKTNEKTAQIVEHLREAQGIDQ